MLPAPGSTDRAQPAEGGQDVLSGSSMAKSMPTAESFFYPEVSFPEFQAELGMLAYDCHLTWKVHLGVRGRSAGESGSRFSPHLALEWTPAWSQHRNGGAGGHGLQHKLYLCPSEVPGKNDVPSWEWHFAHHTGCPGSQADWIVKCGVYIAACALQWTCGPFLKVTANNKCVLLCFYLLCYLDFIVIKIHLHGLT